MKTKGKKCDGDGKKEGKEEEKEERKCKGEGRMQSNQLTIKGKTSYKESKQINKKCTTSRHETKKNTDMPIPTRTQVLTQHIRREQNPVTTTAMRSDER